MKDIVEYAWYVMKMFDYPNIPTGLMTSEVRQCAAEYVKGQIFVCKQFDEDTVITWEGKSIELDSVVNYLMEVEI